jgi:hypothetical protein
MNRSQFLSLTTNHNTPVYIRKDAIDAVVDVEGCSLSEVYIGATTFTVRETTETIMKMLEKVSNPPVKISKTQQSLSDNLENPEVLTNPEQFLGPNWKTVLRFWLYYESLTDEPWNELIRRFWAIDDDTYIRAWALARNASIEVIGKDNRDAVLVAAPYPEVLTCELIALHKLEKPFFLPLLVPDFNCQTDERSCIANNKQN